MTWWMQARVYYYSVKLYKMLKRGSCWWSESENKQTCTDIFKGKCHICIELLGPWCLAAWPTPTCGCCCYHIFQFGVPCEPSVYCWVKPETHLRNSWNLQKQDEPHSNKALPPTEFNTCTLFSPDRAKGQPRVSSHMVGSNNCPCMWSRRCGD